MNFPISFDLIVNSSLLLLFLLLLLTACILSTPAAAAGFNCKLVSSANKRELFVGGGDHTGEDETTDDDEEEEKSPSCQLLAHPAFVGGRPRVKLITGEENDLNLVHLPPARPPSSSSAKQVFNDDCAETNSYDGAANDRLLECLLSSTSSSIYL